MSLMGKYCCCTSCECLPSTITFRIPAYSYSDINLPFSSYVVSYSAQDVVLYKCCGVSCEGFYPNYIYRSNGIASGIYNVYNGATPPVLIYTQNLKSFFSAYVLGAPNNFERCNWKFSANIGVAVPVNYFTSAECGTYNDMSNACPITLAEKNLFSAGGNYDDFSRPGRIFYWTQTSTTNCTYANSGNYYYLDNGLNGTNPQYVAPCVIGPSPFTLLGDGVSTPDIVDIEIL